MSCTWDLLDDRQKHALAHCSVFRGGFDVAAAEAVVHHGRARARRARGSGRPLAPPPVRPPAFPGESRFGNYETIRAFAGQELARRGEDDAARTRHSAFFLAAGTAWENEAWHGGIESLQRLGLERENLLAALERSAASGNASEVLRALIALFPIFASQSPCTTFLSLARAARDEERLASVDLRLRARYLLVRGRARQLLSEHAASRADFHAALLAARAASDTRLVARSLVSLGAADRCEGRVNEARKPLGAALRLFEELGDDRAVAVVLGAMGALDLATGALDKARPVLLRAFDMLAGLADEPTRGMVLVDLGLVEQERGDLEAAQFTFDQAIEVHRGCGNLRYAALAMGHRAGVDYEAGVLEGARSRYGEAIAAAASLGDLEQLAHFGAALGAVLACSGERAEALRAFEDAGRCARQQQDPRVAACVALHRATADLVWDDAEAARRREAMAAGLANQSNDVRFARRMMQRKLGDAPAREETDEGALVVAEDASFVRSPEGQLLPLGRRDALKRVLVALAWRRVDSPGKAVPHDVLVAAGWPGQKLEQSVALNRLNVTLTRAPQARPAGRPSPSRRRAPARPGGAARAATDVKGSAAA